MKVWLLIVGALVVQELALESAALVKSHALHLNLWIVHLTFLVGTLFDIWIGYRAGKYAQKRFHSSRLEQFVAGRANQLEKAMGKRGKRFALVVLGFISFAHVDAFVFSWLDIPFRTVLFYVALGDTLQYILLWATIAGAVTVTHSFSLVLLVAVAVSAGIIVVVERTQAE